ncbi:methyltransferase [Arthrobacter sp. A2-55]|uniref:methyltransferase n=1 Tax=Arthrobacter sp. A2-55 TaxID=2897337 RepID=UPI00292FB8AD|nr:methyltransferase domain-containing protein [Arthrobacter sp. A2-55]
MGALHEERARSVVDMGCGEGALLKILFADHTISRIVGTDVSARMLDRAEERLRLRELSERQQERLQLLQSSATYLDDRLRGYDAMVLMEVIEHIDLERLPALAVAVFGHAKPKTVVVTTPNAEYNQLYPGLACGSFRHPDHRFEWSRSDFQQWASEQAAQWNYTVEHRGVGEHDDKCGTPTQLALFRRA